MFREEAASHLNNMGFGALNGVSSLWFGDHLYVTFRMCLLTNR